MTAGQAQKLCPWDSWPLPYPIYGSQVKYISTVLSIHRINFGVGGEQGQVVCLWCWKQEPPHFGTRGSPSWLLSSPSQLKAYWWSFGQIQPSSHFMVYNSLRTLTQLSTFITLGISHENPDFQVLWKLQISRSSAGLPPSHPAFYLMQSAPSFTNLWDVPCTSVRALCK